MTLCLVKHASNDFRLHRADGTELNTGSERPDKRTQVDWLAAYHNGASILGDPDARKQFTDIVADDVRYRDLTVPDETVPWNGQ